MLIVITGGSGFLGKNLAKKFINHGHKVLILDINNTKPFVVGAEFIKCDLTKKSDLSSIKVNNANIILHCAGQPSVAKSFENPLLDLNVNILGTFNLLEWAKKNNTKKIIYASTFNVYKENQEISKLSEQSLCSPKSFYAISKKTAEDYIIIYGNNFGINWNIVRMFNIYGPGQNPNNNFLGMVSIFLNMARLNKTILVKGSLKRFRDFIFIDDVVEAWYKIAISKKNNKIYNLGFGKKIFLKDLLRTIIIITKSKSKIKPTKATPGDFNGCYSNINLIKKDFNFRPRTNLFKGIKIFNDWLNKYYGL